MRGGDDAYRGILALRTNEDRHYGQPPRRAWAHRIRKRCYSP